MSEVMVVPMARTPMSNNPKRGEGWGSMFKSVGKAVAPIAIDAGSSMLKKRMGGGSKKGSARVGQPAGSRLAYDDTGGGASPYVSGAYDEAMDRHSQGGGWGMLASALAPAAMKLMGMGVDLSPAQVRSLKKGGAITINPKMIMEKGRHLLQLLPQSAKKLLTAIKKNKGMRLLLKQGEDVIDRLKGGSIFGKIFKAVAPALIDAGASLLKSKAGKGTAKGNARKGQPAGSRLAYDDIGEGVYPAGRRGKGWASKLAKSAVKAVAPVAIDAGSKMLKKKVSGDGIFDVIKSVGKAVAPIAIDAGSSMLKKRMGGGMYPAGSGMFPAGGAITQLGSPYQSINSPAMHPFVGTTGLSGYSPITEGVSRSGGSMLPIDRAVGRVMRPKRIGMSADTYTPRFSM